MLLQCVDHQTEKFTDENKRALPLERLRQLDAILANDGHLNTYRKEELVSILDIIVLILSQA